ncbi:MAG TPA: hypothetical protein VK071_07740 [Tissierellales bacterium]|nr:hypothetical protein [Tissierellales bacterium]
MRIETEYYKAKLAVGLISYRFLLSRFGTNVILNYGSNMILLSSSSSPR